MTHKISTEATALIAPALNLRLPLPPMRVSKRIGGSLTPCPRPAGQGQALHRDTYTH
jgi:hypothetical protein